jgi:hypothetical protein
LINLTRCGPILGMRSGRPKAELVLSREEREALEGAGGGQRVAQHGGREWAS